MSNKVDLSIPYASPENTSFAPPATGLVHYGRKRRIVAAAVAALFLAVATGASTAWADLIDPIIGVANATGPCSSGPGGTICAGGTTAFSLTDLLNGTEGPLQAVVGTNTSPVYLVNNDTGRSSFTLTFSGEIAFNQFLTCQENGGFAGKSCSITGSLGTVGTGAQYGPPAGLANGTFWNPDATLTFTGIGAGDFDITFASFGNGASGALVVVPEPSSLMLTGIGLLVLVVVLAWHRGTGVSVRVLA